LKKFTLSLLASLAALPIAAALSLAADAGGSRVDRDYRQTREIIDSILSEESRKGGNSSQEKDAAPILPDESKEQPLPAEKEKKTAPPPPNGAAKDEGAPKVSGEEEVLLKTGIDFYNNGLYDPALRNFQEMVTRFPQGTLRESARFWMGRIHMKAYRYDEAIKEFAAVTPESGDYPASLFLVAESYQMKGDRVASIENYQRVYARFPDHELADRALLAMGKLYLAGRNGAQALDSAVKLIRQYKDRDTVDDAYYLIGKVYEGDPLFKDIETARRVYRRFLEKGETDRRFGASPLRRRVEDDLRRIERAYFRMER
jgi:TolA-binding protein